MTGEEEAEAVGWSDLQNFLFLLSSFFFSGSGLQNFLFLLSSFFFIAKISLVLKLLRLGRPSELSISFVFILLLFLLTIRYFLSRSYLGRTGTLPQPEFNNQHDGIGENLKR